MGAYIEYSDYDALFPNGLSEESFEKYCPLAEAYIDAITHNRAEDATGYKAARVKQAVCAVIKELAAQDAAKNESGARLTSVSNDGYTEDYGASGDASAEAENICLTAQRWLSGTGLVSLL